MPAFDLIGDIHGHLAPLEALLASLGYRKRHGAWGHPDRTALFLGDYIDRGPEQLGVLTTVRGMIDAGNAVGALGNHELNGCGWGLRGQNGQFLRVHGSKNRHQHAAFLNAVGDGSALHAEYLDWFRTLPLFLDLGHVRLVHACWHPEQIAVLKSGLDAGNRLPEGPLDEFFQRGHPLCDASEIVLKGPEIALPPGVIFHDKDGHERRNTRIRWWEPAATTFRSAALVDPETAAQLPDTPLPAGAMPDPGPGGPVFFGHYWMTGTPQLVSPRFACLDFSIANGGALVAYSFDGEPELSSEKLRWATQESRLEADPEPA